MTDLTRLTAAGLSDALASGETSSTEATRAHLDRIGEVDGVLHAFLHTGPEDALAAAAEADRRRAAGDSARYSSGTVRAVAAAQGAACYATERGTGGSADATGCVLDGHIAYGIHHAQLHGLCAARFVAGERAGIVDRFTSAD